MIRILALAIVVAACGFDRPVPPYSQNSTGILEAPSGAVGCPLDSIEGDLLRDFSTGTAISVNGERRAIVWPSGFRARPAGTETEILDPSGVVVARTGTHVRLEGGMASGGWWVACGTATLLGPAGDPAFQPPSAAPSSP